MSVSYSTYFKGRKHPTIKRKVLCVDFDNFIEERFIKDNWIVLYYWGNNKEFCEITRITSCLIPSNLQKEFLKDHYQNRDDEITNTSIDILIEKEVKDECGETFDSFELSKQLIKDLEITETEKTNVNTTYYSKNSIGELEPIIKIEPRLKLVSMKLNHEVIEYLTKNNLGLAIQFLSQRNIRESIYPSITPFEKTVKTQYSISKTRVDVEYDSDTIEPLYYTSDICGKLWIDKHSILELKFKNRLPYD
ncbi:hypothetical protein [Pseudotenacibaculum haliotis]|uniref:Uncharacterized protein n=1 Tax=Pseudotenacibaculum haliotis TaxID=1862138 RepID=A0ABW5LUQ3_9FLAO